jgi:hypothetical protein
MTSEQLGQTSIFVFSLIGQYYHPSATYATSDPSGEKMNTGKPSSETGSNRKGIRLLPVRAENARPLRLGERG